MKVIRSWTRICLPYATSMAGIVFAEDSDGQWIGFTERASEGPNNTFYFPITKVPVIAEAIEKTASCAEKKYTFFSYPIVGKEERGKAVNFVGSAYMLVTFRFTRVIVINGYHGWRVLDFTSSRHAMLVARFIRGLSRRSICPTVPK